MGARQPRLESVDLLRGVVMVLMALDHTRDYFTDAHFDPVDLSQTSLDLFLTRWITDFCAPVFFFLAGVGAGLSRAAGRPVHQLAPYLVKRGLLLIALEFTVVRFGWEFNLELRDGLWLGVIWALGVSMIFLAALSFLPTALLVAFGLTMIAGHNRFDSIEPNQLGVFAPAWSVLHVPGPAELAGARFFVVYPLVPWIGVMVLGYTFAPILLVDRAQRTRFLLSLGVGLTVTFILVRAANSYGDPWPWSVQSTPALTVASFLNTTKYPPSLLFLLMTLGPAITALATLEAMPAPFARWLAIVGRVPLFFYVVHIYALHALAVGTAATLGYPLRPFLEFPDLYPADYGFRLSVVYGIWLAVVVGLYPLCNWVARRKEDRKGGWLSYF